MWSCWWAFVKRCGRDLSGQSDERQGPGLPVGLGRRFERIDRRAPRREQRANGRAAARCERLVWLDDPKAYGQVIAADGRAFLRRQVRLCRMARQAELVPRDRERQRTGAASAALDRAEHRRKEHDASLQPYITGVSSAGSGGVDRARRARGGPRTHATFRALARRSMMVGLRSSF